MIRSRWQSGPGYWQVNNSSLPASSRVSETTLEPKENKVRKNKIIFIRYLIRGLLLLSLSLSLSAVADNSDTTRASPTPRAHSLLPTNDNELPDDAPECCRCCCYSYGEKRNLQQRNTQTEKQQERGRQPPQKQHNTKQTDNFLFRHWRSMTWPVPMGA